MDAASKLGWFVAGLIVGGSIGVIGMWLAYGAGRLLQGLEDDAEDETGDYGIELEAALDADADTEKPSREEPGYIRRLNEAKRREQL